MVKNVGQTRSTFREVIVVSLVVCCVVDFYRYFIPQRPGVEALPLQVRALSLS